MAAIEPSERFLVAGLLEIPAFLVAALLNVLSECNRTPAPFLFAFLGGQVFPAVYLVGWSARLHLAVKIVGVVALLLVAVAGYALWGFVSVCP